MKREMEEASPFESWSFWTVFFLVFLFLFLAVSGLLLNRSQDTTGPLDQQTPLNRNNSNPLLSNPALIAQSDPVFRIGTLTNQFFGIIEKIEDDLHKIHEKESAKISIIIGPYFVLRGISSAALDSYYAPNYFIIIDNVFFNKLSDLEKEALIAHESGHIIFSHYAQISVESITENQKRADEFAIKYVDPKHLISLLEKSNYEHQARIEHLKELSKNR